MDAQVTTDLQNGVLHVKLNRPEAHNAFDEALVEALRQAVEHAGAEKEARVVVLSGAGPSFCAGADLEWMREMGAASEEENRLSARRLARLFHALDRIEKPLIGRIHGSAIGGGAGLAAVCDIAIASTSCRFALSEVRLGLIPAVIAPYIVRRVGPGRARELILTGRRFEGAEAAALGLVTRTVDESLLDAAVGRVVSDLRAGGPRALAHAKSFLRELESRPRSGEELSDWTAETIATIRAGEEARSGLTAFIEKVPPAWLRAQDRPGV